MSNQWKSKRISGSKRRPARRPVRGTYSPRRSQSNGRSWYTIGSWVLTGAILVGILYLLFVVLPRVTITVIPETRDVIVEETVVLSTDKSDAEEENVLHVQRIATTAKVGGHFVATGKKDIGERTRGTVTFFNGTGLTYELLVEDGLETIDGVGYTTTRDLAIPPASVSPQGDIVPGSIQADIVAVKPGEEANISPQKIFIKSVAPDKQHIIYAQNDWSLSGGSSNEVTVISQEDIDKAQEQLRESLSRDVIQEMQQELDHDRIVLTETLKLTEEVFQADVDLDQEVSEFDYTFEAQAESLVITEEVLNELLLKLAFKQIGPDEQLILEEPSQRELREVSEDVAGNTRVVVYAVWPVGRPVDFDGLKEQVMGLREADARRVFFQDPTVTDVRFDWSFALSHRIPKISSHVTLELGAAQ